jgi:hypothetical protein
MFKDNKSRCELNLKQWKCHNSVVELIILVIRKKSSSSPLQSTYKLIHYELVNCQQDNGKKNCYRDELKR